MTVTSPSPATDARSGKLRPGGIWYVIGTLLILGGIAALIGLIAAGAVKTSRAVDRYARFVVTKEGTEATIDVTQAGSYTFYYESQSTVEHKQYTAPADPPPDLQVAAKARGGADLVVSPSTNETSFSISGKVGRAVFSVRVPAPGTYVVRATGGTAATPFVVSMGKGQVGRLAAYIVSGLGLGALLGIAGLVTLIVTGSKRKKSRRAQLAMAASLPHGGPFWSGPASSVSGATPTGPWSGAAPAPSGTGYSPPGYAQPGYAQPGSSPPGYPPPGYVQPGYTPPGPYPARLHPARPHPARSRPARLRPARLRPARLRPAGCPGAARQRSCRRTGPARTRAARIRPAGRADAARLRPTRPTSIGVRPARSAARFPASDATERRRSAWSSRADGLGPSSATIRAAGRVSVVVRL